uniref:Methyltransferase like 21C n=1 Tax=Cyprinus carpio TaxID=7962 RepID=A0A8C2FWK5_CYPCA
TKAVSLCQDLEQNREHVDLLDKAVLELGAGTGLVSIVASLLGAWVMATDLPDVRCRYTPQVVALVWGQDVKRDFLSTIYNYDYVLCADVVYHHNLVEDLLITMQYFCKPGTTLLWANKVRLYIFPSIPQEEIRIYQATAMNSAQMREEENRENRHDVSQELYDMGDSINVQ